MVAPGFCCWLPGLPIAKRLPKGVSSAMVEMARLTPKERAKTAIHLHHNPNVGWHECIATVLPAEAPRPFRVSVDGGSWEASHHVEFSYSIYADGSPKVPHRSILLGEKNSGQPVARAKAVKILAALRQGSKLPPVEGGLWDPPKEHRAVLAVALAEAIERFDRMAAYAVEESA